MSSAYSIQKKFCHFILSVKLSLAHTQICLRLRERYNVRIEKTISFTYLDLKKGGWLFNLHVPQNSKGCKFGKIFRYSMCMSKFIKLQSKNTYSSTLLSSLHLILVAYQARNNLCRRSRLHRKKVQGFLFLCPTTPLNLPCLHLDGMPVNCMAVNNTSQSLVSIYTLFAQKAPCEQNLSTQKLGSTVNLPTAQIHFSVCVPAS